MASKGKRTPYDIAIERLARHTRERPHSDLLWKTIMGARDSITEASTFSLVLSTAVEQALEIAICTHFAVSNDAAQPLFNDQSDGPLSTFAAKTRMAYALGVFDAAVRDELSLIRYIRNAFAHTKEVLTFESTLIVDACNELRIPNKWRLANQTEPHKPRDRFRISAEFLFLYLESPEPNNTPKRFTTSRDYSLVELPPLRDRHS